MTLWISWWNAGGVKSGLGVCWVLKSLIIIIIVTAGSWPQHNNGGRQQRFSYKKHACLFSPLQSQYKGNVSRGLDVDILSQRVRCPLILLFHTPRQVWVISHQSSQMSYRPCMAIASSVEAQWDVTIIHRSHDTVTAGLWPQHNNGGRQRKGLLQKHVFI